MSERIDAMIAELRVLVGSASLHGETIEKIEKIMAYCQSEQKPGWTIHKKMPHETLAKTVLNASTHVINHYIRASANSSMNDSGVNLSFTNRLLSYCNISTCSDCPGSPVDPLFFIGIALIEMSISLVLNGMLMAIFLAMSVAFPPLIPMCLGVTSFCFSVAMLVTAWISCQPSGLSLMINEFADAMDNERNFVRLSQDINSIECDSSIKDQIDAVLYCANTKNFGESIDVLTDVKAILLSEDDEVFLKLRQKYAPSTGAFAFFSRASEPSELSILMISLMEAHRSVMPQQRGPDLG